MTTDDFLCKRCSARGIGPCEDCMDTGMDAHACDALMSDRPIVGLARGTEHLGFANGPGDWTIVARSLECSRSAWHAWIPTAAAAALIDAAAASGWERRDPSPGMGRERLPHDLYWEMAFCMPDVFSKLQCGPLTPVPPDVAAWIRSASMHETDEDPDLAPLFLGL